MPKYKLILTVQDSYGMTKEIEAGIVDAAEYELTDTEIEKVIKTMDATFATEAEAEEMARAAKVEVIEELPEIIENDTEVHQVIEQNIDTIKYDSFTD